MRTKVILVCLSVLAVVGLASLSGQKTNTPSKPKLEVSIKPQHVADALHAIIKGQREVYSQVSENQKGLPSPCEFLRQGSEAVASKGVEYAYVLRSLKPLNKRNSPETETEIKGLQYVAQHPDAAFSSEELLGGRWYWTVVYPDVAVTPSCVSCHNARQEMYQFKKGDVLGGLVIRIALEL
jgi:hypothetical protein